MHSGGFLKLPVEFYYPILMQVLNKQPTQEKIRSNLAVEAPFEIPKIVLCKKAFFDNYENLKSNADC